MRQYQTALDGVLESDSDLSDCVTRCCHCGIRFLTHPRCVGRLNLRCVFGCRKHHRRQRSCQRSTAYYRTESGRAKKKRLNARRSRSASADSPPRTDALPPADPPPEEPAECLPVKAELRLEEVVLDAESVRNSPILPYVRMVVNLIEGIQLRGEELVERLIQALRQHRIAYRRRADYVLRFLHQHPP